MGGEPKKIRIQCLKFDQQSFCRKKIPLNAVLMSRKLNLYTSIKLVQCASKSGSLTQEFSQIIVNVISASIFYKNPGWLVTCIYIRWIISLSGEWLDLFRNLLLSRRDKAILCTVVKNKHKNLRISKPLYCFVTFFTSKTFLCWRDTREFRVFLLFRENLNFYIWIWPPNLFHTSNLIC